MKPSIRPRLWLPPKSAFAGFRFPAEVIVVAVRWYLRFNLSFRDVEELPIERGVEVDHVTVYRWVQRFTPVLPAPVALADLNNLLRHDRQAIGAPTHEAPRLCAEPQVHQ